GWGSFLPPPPLQPSPHPKTPLSHLGPEGAYCWAQARGIPTSQVALKTAKAVCKICQIVKPLQVEAGSHRQVPRGDQPTQIWQVDYVGPLPHDHRKANILTMVDTATGYGEVWPASRADQWNTITK
uniref:Integrase catalytic domain-containing protein n=1 Tax=Terrapene triunguis TaxID=2587831 RepID=A0A674IL34_9SAUR